MGNILLPILIAILSPFFTIWLALKKFKHEQKWQKKVEVIEELCEIIDRIILQGEIWEKDINRQKQLIGKDSKVFNIFAEELAKLKTHVTKVDILFDWGFSEKSDKLISDLEKAYSESIKENNPQDFSYVWLKKMKEFRIEFVKKAKNAMNWKKGFRRIVLIWAVLAAIGGAIVGFKIAAEDAAKELEHAQDMLQMFEKGNGVGQSFLLDEWKECTSLEVQEWHLKYIMGCTSLECQEWQWKLWTGEDLEESFKKSAVEEKNFRKKNPSWTPTLKALKLIDLGPAPKELKAKWEEAPIVAEDEDVNKIKSFEEIPPAYTYTWMMSQESRQRLKEQGWQTVNGEVLPYTPDMVSSSMHKRDLKEARYKVRAIQFFYRPLGIAVGGAVGFGGFWLAYLILERLVSWTAWLTSWVTRGFHNTDTEQRSGDVDEQGRD